MERIKKENWEDIDLWGEILGVEIKDSGKYYLVPNCEGFVPVNLKIHTLSSYSDTSNLEHGLEQAFNQNGKRVYRFDSMQEMILWVTS
jgi:hypothetical protein